MAGKPPDGFTSEQFIWAFLTWLIQEYSPAAPPLGPEPSPAPDHLTAYSVQIRAEHVAALKAAALKKGTTPSLVLRTVLDAWLAEQYAKTQ